MSLLMDALKRAERARQAEAERVKSDGPGEHSSGSREMSLDPMDPIDYPAPDDDAEVDTVPPASPPPPSAPRTPPAPAPGTDTEDSLELTPPEVRREIEAMLDPEAGDTGSMAADVPASSGGVHRTQTDATSLSLEYGDIPLDETGATLPSMRAAQRSVQDYFDGTHSMSLSMEDMQEAIAAERPQGADPEAGVRTSTMDGDTTSRRQAQAILDARAVAPSNSARNALLLVLLALVIGGIGGGAYMFKDRILALIDGEPAIVVARPPAVRVAPPPQVAEAARGDQPTVLPADERDALLRAAEQARAEEQRVAERAAAEARAETLVSAPAATAAPALPDSPPTDTSSAQTQASAEPALAEVSSGSSASAPAGAVTPLPRMPAPARADDPVALSDVMRTDATMREMNIAGSTGSLTGFKISKRRRASRTHAELVSAYDAFNNGDDGAAMAAYQEVLAREPRNRDAMLGAAAVLMRSGASEAASRYYGALLRMNPRDSAAQAALIALQEDLDPTSGESHVKRLLERAPDEPNLHFTLGNLYAEQGRWPEAQSSYFEAYRLDSGNPDYAFNLAVSLDRLAQGKAAAGYYRRAMELSQGRPASFETAAVVRRLATLGGS